MSPATELRRMAVVPREGYFCNDGRGWQSHWTGRGNALAWPWPTTLAGALRSAWGRKDEERLGRTYTREDWLALAGEIRLGTALPLRRSWRGSRRGREAWGREHLAWPAPADALAVDEGGQRQVVALRPRPLARAFGAESGVLGRDESAATDLLWLPLPDREIQLGKPAREPAWWSDARFRLWLRGAKLGPADPEDAFDFPRRFQVHVRIDPGTQTAEEHFLYAHDQ
ncbi:MAG: hypothetical protein IRZ11_08745, partial [Clostridia bacterium]|nr:hypothetical protein [Clostridia bacterium]